MNNHTQPTKEDRILENLDKGDTLRGALSRAGADDIDLKLYETLARLDDASIEVPSRTSFERLLRDMQAVPTPSPYVPMRSVFAHVRFAVPALLGLLIVVSGIGIETGRISFEQNIAPVADTVRDQKVKEIASATQKTTVATFQTARSVEEIDGTATPAATSTMSAAGVTEENYDAYFEEESTAFITIADAYEVII